MVVRGFRASGLFARAGIALVVASAPVAQARSTAEVGYTREQGFSGALRYLRVDLDYEVVEKDPESAYLLFRYPALEGTKSEPGWGAIEVVAVEGGIRITVTLKRSPSYREEVVRRGLLDKLRADYGEPIVRSKEEPTPRPRPEPETPPQDSPPQP